LDTILSGINFSFLIKKIQLELEVVVEQKRMISIHPFHPLQKDKRDAVGSSNPTWRNYDHEYWIGIERELEMVVWLDESEK
jgi:hypothetical protein